MRIVDSAENDSASTLSVSINSESSFENYAPREMANGNGSPSQASVWTDDSSLLINGNGVSTNGLKRNIKEDVTTSNRPIPQVTLPGTRLFEDSCIDREEFIRLVIQSLRDVGYL